MKKSRSRATRPAAHDTRARVKSPTGAFQLQETHICYNAAHETSSASSARDAIAFSRTSSGAVAMSSASTATPSAPRAALCTEDSEKGAGPRRSVNAVTFCASASNNRKRSSQALAVAVSSTSSTSFDGSGRSSLSVSADSIPSDVV